MSTLSSAMQTQSRDIRLIKAAAAGDFDSAKGLIAAGVDVNSSTEHGMTALMNAAAIGHLGLVNHLLACGADINAKRYDGLNALALAVFFGHPDVVSELLDCGADATVKSRFGTSLEAWASARGFPAIARLLTEAKSAKSVRTPVSQIDDSNPAVTQLMEVQEPLFSEAVLTNERVCDEHAYAREASRITVQIHQNSSPDREQTVSINSSALTAESPAPGWNITDETYQKKQLTRWLTDITSDWQRLTVLTLVVMLVCGLCTFAILQLLSANKQTVKPANVSEPATLDAQRFNVEKRDANSTTRRKEISSTRERGDTSGKGSSHSSIDSWKTRGKASVVSPAQPIENPNNLRLSKNASRKPAERVADLPAKQPRTIRSESQPALTAAPSFDSASRPAKKNSSQVATGLVLEESGVRTPPAAPRALPDVEMQRPGRAAAGAPPMSTGTPLRNTKPKVIQWP